MFSTQIWHFTLLKIPRTSFPQLNFEKWDIQSSYSHLTMSFGFITEACCLPTAIQDFLHSPALHYIVSPLLIYQRMSEVRFLAQQVSVRHHHSGRHWDVTSEDMDLITSIKFRISGTLPPRLLHFLTTGSYTKQYLFHCFLPIRYNAFG